jgi:UDP-glucose 4-epimerase
MSQPWSNCSATHRFDSVIHFAAYKSVNESVEKPLTVLQEQPGLVNGVAGGNEAAIRFTILIFSSSCTVYGQPDQIPVDESARF